MTPSITKRTMLGTTKLNKAQLTLVRAIIDISTGGARTMRAHKSPTENVEYCANMICELLIKENFVLKDSIRSVKEVTTSPELSDEPAFSQSQPALRPSKTRRCPSPFALDLDERPSKKAMRCEL
jgi:hypothetical protein